MPGPRYIIGRGELLTSPVPPPGGGAAVSEVYSLNESVQRLAAQLTSSVDALAGVTALARPDGLATIKLTMHPSYIAKSYFPTRLLRATGLTALGSRETTVVPRKLRNGEVKGALRTTELLVAGPLAALRDFSNGLTSVTDEYIGAVDLRRIERIQAMEATDRVRGRVADTSYFEVGLHLFPGRRAGWLQNSFQAFATDVGVELKLELAVEAGGMLFVPATGSEKSIRDLAAFSLLRVVRPLGRIRRIPTTLRANNTVATATLPQSGAISDEPKVAILDGGLPSHSPLRRWVRRYELSDPTASDVPQALAHGLAVTSAFLFGPIAPGKGMARPYSLVDHYRVIDEGATKEDPYELFRTLGHIEEVLLSRRYEFVGLSVGPDMPVDDGDVHVWTSLLDELLSDGLTLLVSAAGNNGESDTQLGLDRVQVPGDGVNVFAVGACSRGTDWQREIYSARGPGRSPGFVKPDVVAFGGNPSDYFHALAVESTGELSPLQGTSFAAPSVLRTAVGVRAVLGKELSPLAIRALLVHAAERDGNEPVDVGFGRVPDDLNQLIVCEDTEVRIVYQGTLKAGKFLRAPVPLPKEALNGLVTLQATFCTASDVDPQDAASYTRAGLEIRFRPNSAKVREGSKVATSKSFFGTSLYAREDELRRSGGKWETTLKDSQRMRGSSLSGATFDIHYVAREGGADVHGAPAIPYALVVSIFAPKNVNLYQQVLSQYPQLVPLLPQIPVPVRLG